MNPLRAWREAKGLLAKDVAAQLEISPVALWRYEKGRRLPCPDVARRIESMTAGALRVDYLDRQIVNA